MSKKWPLRVLVLIVVVLVLSMSWRQEETVYFEVIEETEEIGHAIIDREMETPQEHVQSRDIICSGTALKREKLKAIRGRDGRSLIDEERPWSFFAALRTQFRIDDLIYAGSSGLRVGDVIDIVQPLHSAHRLPEEVIMKKGAKYILLLVDMKGDELGDPPWGRAARYYAGDRDIMPILEDEVVIAYSLYIPLGATGDRNVVVTPRMAMAAGVYVPPDEHQRDIWPGSIWQHVANKEGLIRNLRACKE